MSLFKKKLKANKEEPVIQEETIEQKEISDSVITDEENMSQEERNQHINNISNRFISRSDYSDHDLEGLSIQDMCILINNGKFALNNHMFSDQDERLKGLIGRFYEILIRKIKETKVLYTVIDNNTSYPFIDENAKDCVWLFSCKKYAQDAVDYFGQQYRNFSIQEVTGEYLQRFFADLYMMGAYGAYIDNGLASCTIRKEDVLEPPNWEDTSEINIPVTNPEFMLAHLKMSQELTWNVSYPEREQVLDRLEQELSRQSVKARFLVPVKGMPKADGSGAHEITLKKDTDISIPCLNGKDGSYGIPVFTDWQQFNLCYSDKEFGGWIMSFDDVAAMIKDGKHTAFVINFGKCPMEVTTKNLERIKKVLESLDKDNGEASDHKE